METLTQLETIVLTAAVFFAWAAGVHKGGQR